MGPAKSGPKEIQRMIQKKMKTSTQVIESHPMKLNEVNPEMVSDKLLL